MRKRATADRADQKRLRDELRAIGFYISDWSGPGFAPSDFDELVRSGQIKITGSSRAHPTRLACCCATEARERASRIKLLRGFQRAVAVPTAAVAAARAMLAAPRHPLAEATAHVPDVAGLYAIYAHTGVWRQLGLGEPPDDRPLYVGKAEDSSFPVTFKDTLR